MKEGKSNNQSKNKIGFSNSSVSSNRRRRINAIVPTTLSETRN